MLKHFFAVLMMCVLAGSAVFAAEKEEAKSEGVNLSSSVSIEMEQLSLNDSLLAIRTSTGINVILAPELSSPQMLNKLLTFKTGTLGLRELLDQICAQTGGYWKVTDDGKAIGIEQRKSGASVVKEGKTPLETKLDVQYPGVDLAAVAVDLQDKTGAVIDVAQDIRGKKIELMVKSWTLQRILDHIGFMYEVSSSVDKDGKVSLSAAK